MVYNSESLGLWTLSIVRNSKELQHTALRKLDLFPSSGERTGTSTVLGPIPSPEDGNRSSFRNVVFSSCFELQTMDKGCKLNDSEINSCLFKYFIIKAFDTVSHFPLNATVLLLKWSFVPTFYHVLSVFIEKSFDRDNCSMKCPMFSLSLSHFASNLLKFKISFRDFWVFTTERCFRIERRENWKDFQHCYQTCERIEKYHV
jgi:hypothetical protein